MLRPGDSNESHGLCIQVVIIRVIVMVMILDILIKNEQ